MRATLEPSRITIGDRARLAIDVILPEGSEVIFPELRGQLEGLEVKGLGWEPFTRAGRGEVRYAFWATVTAYATGIYVVPPLSITVRTPDGKESAIETLALSVEVTSVIPEGDPLEDIRDIKGPMSLAGSLLWPWVFMALLLFLGGIGWFVLKRKRTPEPLTPPPPPHVTALEALDNIDASGLAQQNVKEYHFLVSGVLRHYLEERFGFKAPEQTTEEFLGGVIQDHLLRDAQKQLLKSFLEQCDLVKFARYTPSNRETRGVSQTTRDFINETKAET